MIMFIKKLVVFSILSVLLASCGGNAEKTETLLINFNFSNNENCTTYLAERYVITLFNSNQEKYLTKNVPCSSGTSNAKAEVKSDKYYITIELKDANDNTKSFGSGTVDMQSNNSVNITMNEYQGGINLSWNKDDCQKYNLGLISFTIEQDENPINVNIWGKDTTLKDFKINCSAETLLINNIKSGKYLIKSFGFKDEQSEIPRISYNVPEFKLTSGQESLILLDKYMEIEVSDLEIPWNFDSRSIKSCKDANVTKIKASLESSAKSFEKIIDCSDSDKNILFYDIPQNEYNLSVKAVDSNDKTLFSAEKTMTIKKGHIGEDSLKEKEILLK